MIINFIIKILFDFFTAIFSFLPVVTLASIPVIGDTISSILLTMVQKYNAFTETFPYAQTGMRIFVYVILPVQLLMIVAKFFLGSRVPHNDK